MTKPFGSPVPVDGVNTNLDERFGWLSADQLTIYFSRKMSGSVNEDLYTGIRAQLTGSFTGVAMLSGVNISNMESRPVLTADGLTLFMIAAYDIQVATRVSITAAFSAYAPVAAINSTSEEYDVWISDDGLVMYFGSNRSGSYDIFKTTRVNTSSSFSAPSASGELNSSTHNEGAPVLSKDGLEIFFASTRDQSDPNSGSNIFRATRSTPSDGFGMPTLVMELSRSNVDDFPTWMSPDRCQLMFSSNRGDGSGGHDIWIATRPQ